MCNDHIALPVPNANQYIRPGNIVQLSRFDTTCWVVGYGWYAWGGNREVCGWYLMKADDQTVIKPLQKTDLDDMYCITTRG